MLHLKFRIPGFMLIFTYKAKYITWFPFVFFVAQILLCIVCDVTFCVIFITRLWLLLHDF